MTYDSKLAQLGVYHTRAPRYTSYPTAVHFHDGIGTDFAQQQLRCLPADKPISIYIHIPFCERLCWFCACRTQGTKSPAPIAAYLDLILQEITLIAGNLPDEVKIGNVHWGGGTPTILSPEQIETLATKLKTTFNFNENTEFSVEIDPTLVDHDKIDVLAKVGMTRASIGVQDFNNKVQTAIGRIQSVNTTLACIDMLRSAQVNSLNMDILYGLPHQTYESVTETINTVLKMAPDRIALYGYAHVPWMANRQKLIDESILPNGAERRDLFKIMADRLENKGYHSVGIDHFAKPHDTMSIAAKNGTLKRNFQGYTTDTLDTLVGIGASAISKLPNGFVQNSPKSADYSIAIKNKQLATHKGLKTTQEDKLIARTIEMIMCNFSVNYDALKNEGYENLDLLTHPLLQIQKEFGDFIALNSDGFRITEHERVLARIIARHFDMHDTQAMRYSSVS